MSEHLASDEGNIPFTGAPADHPIVQALNAENPGGVCRVCGCTNERGCPPALVDGSTSCSWVEIAGEKSLCSRASCVEAGKLGITGNALEKRGEAEAR